MILFGLAVVTIMVCAQHWQGEQVGKNVLVQWWALRVVGGVVR